MTYWWYMVLLVLVSLNTHACGPILKPFSAAELAALVQENAIMDEDDEVYEWEVLCNFWRFSKELCYKILPFRLERGPLAGPLAGPALLEQLQQESSDER